MSSIFNFSERHSDSLGQRSQVVNSYSDETFRNLLGVVFEALKSSFEAQKLSAVLEEFSSANDLPAKHVKTIVTDLISFTISSLKKNIPDTQIMKQLIDIGFNESKAEIMAEIYKNNQLELSTKKLIPSACSLNNLIDMEWTFGVTAASSELDKVGQTFLQLKLKIGDGLGGVDIVHMELTLPEFYEFLHEMERAKASLDLCG